MMPLLRKPHAGGTLPGMPKVFRPAAMPPVFKPRQGLILRLASGRTSTRTIAFVLGLVLTAVAGGAALLAGRLEIGKPAAPVPAEIEAAAVRAGERMRSIEAFLFTEKTAAGQDSGRENDPGRTGLVGEELTGLTTTLGSLSSKRTATNPIWASALVRRLYSAGLRRGDLVVAGLSGSFPGLNLAVMLACDELGLELGTIVSPTSSTYGANQPGFSWPEMELRLSRAGLLRSRAIAVTPGGDFDSGNGTVLQALESADLAPEAVCKDDPASTARAPVVIAWSVASDLGVPYIPSFSQEDAVASRLTAYRSWAKGRPIAFYINAGGSDASLGRSEEVLKIPSGMIKPEAFDFSPDRGVLARMTESGIPALSLLDVRNLALKWGIPIDE